MPHPSSFASLSKHVLTACVEHTGETFGFGGLLDGMRWMSVGAHWDWSVLGRDLGTVRRVQRYGPQRHDRQPPGEAHLTAAAVAALPSARRAELQAWARVIGGEADSSLRGHRAFWCSDYAAQHAASPYTGAPWAAQRVNNTAKDGKWRPGRPARYRTGRMY